MVEYKCPLCAGRLRRKRVPYAFAGVGLGRFDADVCDRCSEIFFTEKSWSRIERLAKDRHLWGLGKKVKVGYSGHSLVVRIPVEIAKAAHLRKGSSVFLQPAGEGRVLIEKES